MSWNNDKKEVCGTCKYCKFDPADDDWYCSCEDGDEFMEFVRYEYRCDDWEEK